MLGGRRPRELRLPGADPLLQGLYADAPEGLDEGALAMLGVRGTLADLLDSHGGPEELLDLMADESIEVDRAQLRSLWVALAAVEPDRVAPPSRVRAVLGGDIVVAAADDVVVVEAPDLLQLVTDRPLVLAPYDLAESLSELLDLPLVGEVAAERGHHRRRDPAGAAPGALPAPDGPRDLRRAREAAGGRRAVRVAVLRGRRPLHRPRRPRPRPGLGHRPVERPPSGGRHAPRPVRGPPCSWRRRTCPELLTEAEPVLASWKEAGVWRSDPRPLRPALRTYGGPGRPKAC
ncbi:hypothetical protein ACFSTC_02115 [Nonomuraea ferruginea]